MTENNYLLPNEPMRITGNDLDAILEHCTSLETSDITIQSNQPIICEIHGKLAPVTKKVLNHSEVVLLLNTLYGPNGSTMIMSGNDIDTNYEFRPDRIRRFRFRVNGTGCLVDGHLGIQITLRTIPTNPPSIEMMGLPDDVREAMVPEEGVVYVTGATGSGKSTLLASIIRSIIEDPECNRKILTYESPIEFVYDNIKTVSAVVSQSEIPLHLPSFAAGVRNALRRKPRLILVGEARDAETITAVLEAALTGHPVYTTLHTNGVAETLRRLVGSFSEEEQAAKTIDIIETLRLIIWQRLVPTVDGKRTPLREYLIFNQEVRDILLACDPIHVTAKTREILQTHGRTMAEDAKDVFKKGLICERIYKLSIAQSSAKAHQVAAPTKRKKAATVKKKPKKS